MLWDVALSAALYRHPPDAPNSAPVPTAGEYSGWSLPASQVRWARSVSVAS